MVENSEILRLCRILSPAGLRDDEELAEEIENGYVDWAKLVEIANINLLTPALFASLEQKNLLGLLGERQLTGFLHEIYERNKERNHGILRQIEDIENTLSGLSIPLLLLKGAADLSEAIYPDIGMRVMNDIDIMIGPNRFDEALKLLKESGYSEFGPAPHRWHHHAPRMCKDGYPAALEPHFRTVFDRDIDYIPFSDLTSVKSKRAELDSSYVLKPAWHLYHIFLHTQIIDSNHRKWRLALRYLYDFVMVAKAYEDVAEWAEVYYLAKKYKHEKIFEDFLYLADALFGLKTPIKYNRLRGWLHLKKCLWESTLLPDTGIYKLYRAYTEFSDIYSYEALKSYYGLRSKREYPAAFVRYVSYHIRKHLFSDNHT